MTESSESEKYPLDIQDVGPEETAEVLKHYEDGYQEELVRIGPKGYFMDRSFTKMAKTIYDMEIKPDDTWVITFPKSGTTWVQELVWLVAYDFDYAKAEAVPLVVRFPFLEMCMHYTEKCQRKWEQVCTGNKELMKQAMAFIAKSVEDKLATESPRFLKSHLPLSLLSPRLLDSKVVHVARDPRDVAVSYYHHQKHFKIYGYVGDFKTFWNMFINDRLVWTPYFENVKESWEQRNHPNMLFLFYEDLLRDFPAAVRRVAEFLGRPVTKEQVARVCDHLRFDNFKNNNSVNYDYLKELGLADKNLNFVRKGKSGGWRDYFDEELAAQAQRWIDDNLRGSDLRYPSIQME